jgi:hypothetical protein
MPNKESIPSYLIAQRKLPFPSACRSAARLRPHSEVANHTIYAGGCGCACEIGRSERPATPSLNSARSNCFAHAPYFHNSTKESAESEGGSIGKLP